MGRCSHEDIGLDNGGVLTWNPIATARRIADRVTKAFRGDLPPDPPPPTFSETIQSAKKADELRNREHQAWGDLQAKVRLLSEAVSLGRLDQETDPEWQQYRLRVHELEEAKQMAGSGPWLWQKHRAPCRTD